MAIAKNLLTGVKGSLLGILAALIVGGIAYGLGLRNHTAFLVVALISGALSNVIFPRRNG